MAPVYDQRELSNELDAYNFYGQKFEYFRSLNQRVVDGTKPTKIGRPLKVATQVRPQLPTTIRPIIHEIVKIQGNTC